MKTWIIFLLGCLPAAAATVASPAAGAFCRELRPYADNLVSIPLVTRSIAVGRVISLEKEGLFISTADSSRVIDLLQAGAPLRLEVMTGDLAGLHYPVRTWEGGRVGLNTNGDDLTSHALGVMTTGADGDLVRIRTDWTIEDIFGTGADALVAPLAVLDGPTYSGGDCLLFRSGNESLRVVNLASVGWRSVADLSIDVASWGLPPGNSFVFRRASGSSPIVTVVGYVSYGRFVVPVDRLGDASASSMQLALLRPEALALQALGLLSEPADRAPVVSRGSVFEAGDALLTWDDVRYGFSRAAENVFVPVGRVWMTGDRNADDVLIAPGQGFELHLWGGQGRRYWIQNLEEP